MVVEDSANWREREGEQEVLAQDKKKDKDSDNCETHRRRGWTWCACLLHTIPLPCLLHPLRLLLYLVVRLDFLTRFVFVFSFLLLPWWADFETRKTYDDDRNYIDCYTDYIVYNSRTARLEGTPQHSC